jgi:hypothetical protein
VRLHNGDEVVVADVQLVADRVGAEPFDLREVADEELVARPAQALGAELPADGVGAPHQHVERPRRQHRRDGQPWQTHGDSSQVFSTNLYTRTSKKVLNAWLTLLALIRMEARVYL